MNFYPRDYTNQSANMAQLEGDVSAIVDFSFDPYCDDENVEYGAKELENSFNKSTKNVIGYVSNVKIDFESNVFEDFYKNLENFASFSNILNSNNINDDDIDVSFPFNDWFEQIGSVTDLKKISLSSVFSTLSSIKNEQHFHQSLCSFLLSIKNKSFIEQNFINEFEKFAKNNSFLKSLDLENFFKVTNYEDFYSAIKNEPIKLKEKSNLFFIYASKIPTYNWLPTNNKMGDIEITGTSTNFFDIFEHFSKTSIWKDIVSTNTQDKFIEQFLNPRNNHQIFLYNSTHIDPFNRSLKIKSVNWENCIAFVSKALPKDYVNAEYFITKLKDKIKFSLIKNDDPIIDANIKKIFNVLLHSDLELEMLKKHDAKKPKI